MSKTESAKPDTSVSFRIDFKFFNNFIIIN